MSYPVQDKTVSIMFDWTPINRRLKLKFTVKYTDTGKIVIHYLFDLFNDNLICARFGNDDLACKFTKLDDKCFTVKKLDTNSFKFDFNEIHMSDELFLKVNSRD
jgi:hypothetical protein